MEKDARSSCSRSRSPSRRERSDQARGARVPEYLKNAGIAITVQFKEWQAWKEDIFLEHNFTSCLRPGCSTIGGHLSLFHSAEIGDWKNNFGGYSNPEVDGLIVESKLTLDHEKRRTINRKLHSILAEDSPTLSLTLTNYSAYHKKVRRVQIHLTSSSRSPTSGSSRRANEVR